MSVTQTVYHAGIPVDLAAPSRQQIGTSQFWYGDNRSHVFTALVGDTDHPETGLRSGAVTGAVLRHDGVTVVLAGEKGAATVPTVYPNGKAANATACSVTLPQECFAVPGPILITIKLVDGETVTSVLNIGGTVIRTETDSAVDPGEIIPDVSTLAASARAALAAAEEANTAAAGADTAAQAASSAATDAGSAAESAYAAVDDATAAANEAYAKAQVANTAAQAANTAATAAGTAATAADTAATAAAGAAQQATTAAQTAGTAAQAADTAATAAGTAAQAANTAATAAGTAATAADTAASGAGTAAQAANAAAAAASAAMAGAVRFDEAQTLTEAQAAQARGNIGAASAGDIPTGAVRYDTAQTLTEAQAAQARGNIGAASAVELDALATKTVMGLTWAQGTINGTTGQNGSAVSNRIRTNSYYRIPEDSVVLLGLQAGYEATLRDYAADGTFVGSLPSERWGENGERFVIKAGHFLRFVARKTDDANLEPADGLNVTVTLLYGVSGKSVVVAGTTPSITALPGAAYNCIGSGTAAEPVAVTELDFTPSSTGICSVRFVSGTTPTVLTLPQTVEMPDWWTGVEASRTYEISIADGVYGAVTSWA